MLQTPANKTSNVRPAQVYHPARQVALSTKIPLRKRPKENPTGCPPPKHANPTLRCLPFGKFSVRMLTVLGRHMETAIPCKALKHISWTPVCARPQAAVNNAMKKQPARKTLRLPKRSEIEPRTRREQPQVSAYTDDGHNSKLSARWRSSAMRGKATVSMPALILLTVVTPVTVPITKNVRPIESGGGGGFRVGTS